jgi:hypothetical protein
MILKEELVESNIFLEYRLLKPFLTEAYWRLSDRDYEGKELTNMVQSVLGTIQRTFGTPESTASISASDQDALLATILAKLRENREK